MGTDLTAVQRIAEQSDAGTELWLVELAAAPEARTFGAQPIPAIA